MSPVAKLRFYLEYFWAKTFAIWFEVRTPRFEMFVYEMLYSLGRFRAAPVPNHPKIFKSDFVVTKHGRFHIRPNTMDLVCVSPAFERADVRQIIKTALLESRRGKRVLVLDIGSAEGGYAVALGTALKNDDVESFKICAFEPARSSRALLERNIEANDLQDHVEVFPSAAWDEDDQVLALEFSEDQPGSSGIPSVPGRSKIKVESVTTARLDTVFPQLDDFDLVLMKIDVEGAECNVLNGAKRILGTKECVVMVEDFVDDSVKRWMVDNGASFDCKLTPYNSWWRFGSKKSSAVILSQAN